MGRRRRSSYGRDYGVTASDWSTCVCGKRAWGTKRQAKDVVKVMREREAHSEVLRAYECVTAPGRYHVGHTRPAPNRNDGRLSFL